MAVPSLLLPVLSASQLNVLNSNRESALGPELRVLRGVLVGGSLELPDQRLELLRRLDVAAPVAQRRGPGSALHEPVDDAADEMRGKAVAVDLPHGLKVVAQ